MERVQKALRSVVGNKVELEVELARGVALVEADPVLVEQVLLNLALNARDAMPEGGRLRLAVGVAEPCSASCATASGCRYPCARLTVEDNGSGMDDATRARIFEPFFTTKSKGKGTGLGLSIVQDIVEKAKGHVEVQSAPGEGTRFDIYLPRLATA
jgi:signal transduction histidine kinase